MRRSAASGASRAAGRCIPTRRQSDAPVRAGKASQWSAPSGTRCAPGSDSRGQLRAGQQVGEYESVALDDLASGDANRFAEHRAVPRKSMELAAFAAGVDAGRKVVKQRRIELARHEPAIDGARVHAGEARPETAGDHLARESRGIRSEQREEWRESTADEFVLAIASDVLEKQVTERHVREAVGHGRAYGVAHHP